METSIFIARVIAVAYLTTGVALYNGNLDLQKSYKELRNSQMATAFMGMFTLLLGMLITNYHNIWVKDWELVITIIGWILIAEGVLYIAAPKVLLTIFQKLPQSQKGWGCFTFVLGLVFAYFGFFA